MSDLIDELFGYGGSAPADGVAPPFYKVTRAQVPCWERFLRFWDAYPRKVGKLEAWRKFKAVNPDEFLLAAMIEDVTDRLECGTWRLTQAQYILHAKTYIGNRRWEDERDPADEPDRDETIPAGDVLEGSYDKLKSLILEHGYEEGKRLYRELVEKRDKGDPR